MQDSQRIADLQHRDVTTWVVDILRFTSDKSHNEKP